MKNSWLSHYLAIFLSYAKLQSFQSSTLLTLNPTLNPWKFGALFKIWVSVFNDNNPSSACQLQLECCWDLPGKNGFLRQSIAWIQTLQDARAKCLWERAAEQISRGKFKIFCENIESFRRKPAEMLVQQPALRSRGDWHIPSDWHLPGWQSPIRHFISRWGAH